jgi:cytochrome c-type biogenesis protein
MIDVFTNIAAAFFLGLLTPLTAVCVLPLYPGFLAYLSNQAGPKRPIALFGIAVTLGVIAFMFILGLIFTTILQASLTNVIGVVSPIAFTILLFISILLILNIDISRFIPKAKAKVGGSPFRNSFFYGFFFGAIVIPCNPLFIAALFAGSLSATGFAANMISFLSFGVGMAFPLLVFSLVSQTKSQAVIGFMVKHKNIINRGAGILMFVISLYYIIFVFNVFGVV